MKGKIFTPDEANRMLPLVARIADDIVGTYADVNQALQAFQAEETRAKADPGREPHLAARNSEVGTALDRFQRLIEEVEALGGTLRDYERGSIDFYGELDGDIVYLCWQRGEAHVGHWHALDEGFSKRRLLPQAVQAA
jgi:hypothetical protein